MSDDDEIRPAMKDMTRPYNLVKFAIDNRMPFAMMLNPTILNEVGWGGPVFRGPNGETSGEGTAITIALDDNTYESLDQHGEPPQVEKSSLEVLLVFGTRAMRCSIPFRAMYQVMFLFDIAESVGQPRPSLALAVDNSNREDIDA